MHWASVGPHILPPGQKLTLQLEPAHRCGQITWNLGICFVMLLMLLLAVAVLVRIYDLFLTTSMGLVNTQAAEAESPPAITSMSL